MRLDRLRRRPGGVIDRRGRSGGIGGGGFPGGLGSGGGVGGFPSGGRGCALPGFGGMGLLVLLVVGFFVFTQCMGGGSGGLIPDPGAINGFPQVDSSTGDDTAIDPQDKTGEFVDAVGDDIQLTWEDTFKAADRSYQPTAIVLYSGRTQTGCGLGSAQTGPFYCPADSKVYLDASFFNILQQRFGVQGDFAQAYVIAHEVGHHIQNLLGINGQVQQASQDDPSQANALSVRLELQADCLAGAWANSANKRGALEYGDLQEGLNAAAAVGDDRIQESTTGRIDPESFTHGSSEQRQRWLQKGFDSGTIDSCDTFSLSANQL